MERLICLIIGYGFGLIQTGYFYGRLNHIDIRKHGSGNVGTTNALRTLGWKAGVVTFLGDCFKCVLAIVVAHLIYSGNTEIMPVLAMYAGMGAIFGHNYPFYMGFKGGKGIAAMAGLLISTTNIGMVLICLVAFIATVAVTKYVSLGSLVVVVLYLIEIVTYGQLGGYGVSQIRLYEIYMVAAILMVSAFYKHKENIKRLLSGTENKLNFGKNKNV